MNAPTLWDVADEGGVATVAPASEPEDADGRSSLSLRDYQVQAVEGLRENIRAGIKNQILSASTGSGKTEVACFLLAENHRKGKRAIFVADRTNLVEQTSARLDRYGIPHGVIQADHWRRRPWERIFVASGLTLGRRGWPDTDLIIVDEAHALQKTTTDRIGRRDVVTIGLTATPFTRGLGQHYDAVVTVTTTNKLIADGYLTGFDVWAASEPNMSGAKLNRFGEWEEGETAKRAMPIIGDCVAEYLRHGDGKKFLAFGVNIAHCEEMQRQFLAAGVPCELYTHNVVPEHRALCMEEFKKPDTYLRGMITVSALAKGTDVPDVEVIIMARPLRNSLAEHIQILGRGLRPSPGKKTCRVLDHAGNMVRFWDRMQEFFEHGASELDDGKRKEKAPAAKKGKEPYKCPKCARVHEPRPACPACGHVYPKRQSEVSHAAGELRQLSGGPTATPDQKQEIYSQLLYIAQDRGYKSGWVAHKYRERFGVWPRTMKDVPAPPSRQLLGWLRSRQIAQSRQKEARS